MSQQTLLTEHTFCRAGQDGHETPSVGGKRRGHSEAAVGLANGGGLEALGGRSLVTRTGMQCRSEAGMSSFHSPVQARLARRALV